MTWVSRVVCEHAAVLGRAPTVEAWPRHAGDTPCSTPPPVHDRQVGWQVGVRARTPGDRQRVHEALASIGADHLPLAGAIARLSRADLPACSVLLGDGELAAGLAWGEPLGLGEIGAWEYALTSESLADHPWTPLAAGTIAVLDSCGPTVFRVPFPQELT